LLLFKNSLLSLEENKYLNENFDVKNVFLNVSVGEEEGMGVRESGEEGKDLLALLISEHDGASHNITDRSHR
jgi:hypothetical protein